MAMDLNIQSEYQLLLYGQELENVGSLTYLGSVIDPRGGCDLNVQNRISKAQAIFSQLCRHLLNRPDISRRTKIFVYKAAVRSVLFYAVETMVESAATVIKQRRLHWLGLVLRRPNDRIIKQVLLAAPLLDWHRRPGGQLKNWWATAKNDLDLIDGFRRFGRKWESCCLRFA